MNHPNGEATTMGLGTRPFKHGLHDLGSGGFAWLQPDGSWGWSNAGLIVDGDQSLLVDTLFDKALTADMLKAMRRASPTAAGQFDMLVNTHANGDHCNGNELVGGAEIIASKACAEELAAENPRMMQIMRERAPDMGEVGEFFMHCFSTFDFSDINHVLPTRTFEGELQVNVGDKAVLLRQVGPAHTAGDVLAYVPDDGLIFTGDILFIEGHPILWAGPVGNWVAACDYMLGLDVETVVPGHGPITDKRGVQAVRDYLTYIEAESRARFDAGMSAQEAAMDISLADFDSWGDSERIAVNVSVLYKEFSGDTEPASTADLFALMARLHKTRRG
tara:strand:+ start:5920 stop:6915 length:996 start_codon:yes stop_codon:yes gene_type:complete